MVSAAGFAGLREAAPGGDDEPSALLSPIVEVCTIATLRTKSFLNPRLGLLVLSESRVRLQMCDSAEELMVLGLQGLKAELQRVGLKCGGTAQVSWPGRRPLLAQFW